MTHARIAVREVHETTYRALYAAGVSAGEAACAAGMVTRMQVHQGTGIAALLTQLDAIDPARLHLPAAIADGPHGIVLDDPARRAELLIGPLAVDVAIARARPVLVPHLTSHDIMDWYALGAATRAEVTLCVVDVHTVGCRSGTTVLTADGEMHRGVELSALSPSDLVAQCSRARGAVAVFASPVTIAARRPEHTSAGMAERYREAVDRGVYVDAQMWSRAYALGRRYLVPEDTDA